jgi:hypothetical protein
VPAGASSPPGYVGVLRKQPLELDLVGLGKRRPLDFEALLDVPVEPAVAKVWNGALPATTATA